MSIVANESIKFLVWLDYETVNIEKIFFSAVNSGFMCYSEAFVIFAQWTIF